SKKRVQRICRAISDETGRDKVWQDSKTIVDRLNRMMIGGANYFCLGPVSKAYSAVDMHAHRRLRRWLCDKHKEPRPAYKRFPEASLHSGYGLVQLPHRTANLPWAKARVFSESRMREICQSGSMSGNRKQDQAKPD
ncbi:MAG: hypothetical protein DMG77_11925, partial [Acidobacteria bacterium]